MLTGSEVATAKVSTFYPRLGMFAALQHGRCLGICAVALLVLFPGAAWARIVPTYFFAGSAGSRAVAFGRGGADGAGLFELALFFLVEFALEGVDGGRWSAVGYRRG